MFLMIRRVVGDSMSPTLRPGSIAIILTLPASRRRTLYRIGDIVVFEHQGLEKIKRITGLRPIRNVAEIFITGDNTAGSTDSRDFGWLPITLVKGKIIWPMNL